MIVGAEGGFLESLRRSQHRKKIFFSACVRTAILRISAEATSGAMMLSATAAITADRARQGMAAHDGG
jgi:16S rRNA U1498 N3-methylase RsmE